MLMREKLKIVAATSLVWIISLSVLSACAGQGLVIKTWFLAAKDYGSLIRKDDSGAVVGKMTYDAADGYLCYSPSDDEAWRDALNTATQCCNGKSTAAQAFGASKVEADGLHPLSPTPL